MATASVTYSFTGGTAAVAAQVNQDFTDLVNFLNASVVHTDGSKSMTGGLNLAAADPASANVAARKSYVDKQSLGGRPYIQTISLDAGTATSFTTIFDSGALVTPTYNYTALCLVFGISGFSAGSNTAFYRVINAAGGDINHFETSGAVPVSQVASNWQPFSLVGKYDGASGAAVRWGVQCYVNTSNVYTRASAITIVMPR